MSSSSPTCSCARPWAGSEPCCRSSCWPVPHSRPPRAPDSISGYYYTDMRNIFVGTLCALGVFLVAYRGYDGVDESITNVAGFAAIGVALCPTKPTVCTAGPGACPASSVARLSTSQQVVGDIHLALAAITLIALGLMALRFAKHGQPGDGSGQRFAGENVIYPRKRHHGPVLRAPGGAVEPAVAGFGEGALAVAVHLRGGCGLCVRSSWFVKSRTTQESAPGSRRSGALRQPAPRPWKVTGN